MNINSQDECNSVLMDMIMDARHIVVLTGAGISTESGIPDYRSPQGIWSKMAPIQFDDFVRSEETRLEDWRRRFLLYEEFKAAKPNNGHKALAKLDQLGKLDRVVTQNIDGMHQRGGLNPDKVIEIHGNGTYATCLDCGQEMSFAEARDHIDKTAASPRCPACNGLVKAAIINFGQMMPQDKMYQAMEDATRCDLFMVLGSSLVVYPAAALPDIAKQHGAELAIINREPTPMDRNADLVIHDEIGPTLSPILGKTA